MPCSDSRDNDNSELYRRLDSATRAACDLKDVMRRHFPRGMDHLRVGKKEAGALLDGREWREFPQVHS
jgi:hypothetical protein